MNKDIEKNRIHRFLKGIGKAHVDTFCIYQWIERCHYEGWWDLACTLSTNVPPNSLLLDYHRRLEFLLRECRLKLNEQFVEIKKSGYEQRHLVPKEFSELCDDLKISFVGKTQQSVCLTFLGRKLALLEKIDASGCNFHLYNMDAVQLGEWLKNNGLGRLMNQNWKIQELPRKKDKRVLIKALWQDIPDLTKRIYENEKDNALRGAVIDSLIKTGMSGWKKGLGYLAINYGVNIADPAIETIRQRLIKACVKQGETELAGKLSAE